MRRFVLLLGAWALAIGPAFLTGCSDCGSVDVDAGWRSLRTGQIEAARRQFDRAVEACPSDLYAFLGLGYVALRDGDLDSAEKIFERVLSQDREMVEAFVGMGIVHWRRGDVEPARQMFQQAIELDPDNVQALGYLELFFVEAEDPDRPPPVRPDTLTLPARVSGWRFEVRRQGRWEPFYVKGVNIGVGIPGRHATEFPDSATYETWLRLIGNMGANTIRTYTIHAPGLYEALLEYNEAHPEEPIRLLQGVWVEPPPDGENLDEPEWRNGFYAEMRRAVDVIHGRAVVPVRPGHASGRYSADVSPWTLGFLLGREWEAEILVGYNERASDRSEWSGTYVEVGGGTPADVWMARAIEQIVAYETETYNAQRPVAYTNWAPTDPLSHPTEPTVAQEHALWSAFGGAPRAPTRWVGADAVALDPVLMTATEAFAGGLFASYHAYPYYPDFMVLEPALNEARSPFGPSNYWGYLQRLREHHGEMPVLIAEYGIPTSIGTAHFQPQGWHHGGVDEVRMAAVVARMTREIGAAGMAGGVVFSWIDEWFKTTWITEPLEVPRERDRLWYNRMDPEEHYGILAAEAEPGVEGATLEDRLASWRGIPPLFEGGDGSVLRAASDAAYVWLLIEPGPEPVTEVMVGLDVLDPRRGIFRWPPGDAGPTLPVGLEFVLRFREGQVRLLADSAYQPVRVDTLAFSPPGEPSLEPMIENRPAGFFRGRFIEKSARTLIPSGAGEGDWAPLRVVTNPLRFSEDSTEYAAMGYELGILPEGPPPDGLWEMDGGTLEVRIPWQLLNIADPSRRRVLSYDRLPEEGELNTTAVGGIRLVYALEGDGRIRSWPGDSDESELPELVWPPWEQPRWRVRIRPAYEALRDAWRESQSWPTMAREGGTDR